MDGIEWEKSRFKKAFKKICFGDKWVCFKTTKPGIRSAFDIPNTISLNTHENS